MMKKQKKDEGFDEIERMAILQEMEELEKEVTLDISEVIEQPPVAISCGTYSSIDVDGKRTIYPIPIGTYGNFSFVHAYPKVGKSYFMSLLVAAYQGNNKEYIGELKGHREGRKIFHFDTEQSKFHASVVHRRPVSMNNDIKDDDYYYFTLREMNYKQRRNFIEYILYTKHNEENIGLVIIDGAADLCSDVNSMEQSTEVQELLMRWSGELDCHISTIIHSNYGSSKPTGVLGSALEKKAETQIMLEKSTVNASVTNVECRRGRNKKFEKFGFSILDNELPKYIDQSPPTF